MSPKFGNARTCELAGTPIVYHDWGSGPPVVIVHGLNSFPDHWAVVARDLVARGRRVLLPYRRDRAPSGPFGPNYSLATEVADLSALLDVAGPAVTLVGHSFGATISLLAATTRPDLNAMVLYEPPVPGHWLDLTFPLRAMRYALDADDPETALALMVTDVYGDPPARVGQLRADPRQWAALTGGIRIVYTELTAFHATAQLDLSGYPPVRTTVLLGEHTERQFGPSARAIVTGLPNAQLTLLNGQGHFAHGAAPAMFAELIHEAHRDAVTI